MTMTSDETRLDRIEHKLDELVEDNKKRDDKFDKLVEDNKKRDDKFDELVEDNKARNHKLDQLFDQLVKDNKERNDRFDTYQKSIQWLVQLAFSLIASATITVIITSVFRK